MAPIRDQIGWQMTNNAMVKIIYYRKFMLLFVVGHSNWLWKVSRYFLLLLWPDINGRHPQRCRFLMWGRWWISRSQSSIDDAPWDTSESEDANKKIHLRPNYANQDHSSVSDSSSKRGSKRGSRKTNDFHRLIDSFSFRTKLVNSELANWIHSLS